VWLDDQHVVPAFWASRIASSHRAGNRLRGDDQSLAAIRSFPLRGRTYHFEVLLTLLKRIHVILMQADDGSQRVLADNADDL